MATTDVIYFLPPFLAFALIALGMQYKEYITGIFGGLVLFLFGAGVLFSPIPSFTSLINTITGSVCLGFGGYIMIRGSIDEIEGRST